MYSKGLFITIEGGEGSGKSTQIKALKHFIEKNFPHIPLCLTREPGGCGSAEKIREVVVKGEANDFLPHTELLLMIAARVEHMQRVVYPALKKGYIILCDRYIDSTRVYQGWVQGISALMIDDLHKIFSLDESDKTLLIDVPEDMGLERTLLRASEEDRFEKKGSTFHKKVREGYLALAQNDKSGRIYVCDGTIDAETLSKHIGEKVHTWIKNHYDL
jgi:dTMP kinase